jgi:peptide/nickel transport system permease protein
MASELAKPTEAPVSPAGALSTRKPRTLWSDAWRQFRRHHLAMAGLVTFLFLVIACALGPFIYTRPTDEIDFTRRNETPSLSRPFGTNDRGEDILARVLYGGRVSLAVGVVAMLIAVTLGTSLGAAAGYFGGVVDTLLMRLTELLVSLPQLPLLLLIVYLFRDSLRQSIGVEAGTFLMMVTVLGGLRWMPVARLVRAQFLSIKEKEYMEAARCIGVPAHRMILVHMLPNAMSQVIVAGSLAIAAVILAESTLSFLGLGFPPDYPTWGRLLFDAKDLLAIAPHVVLIPGFMIFLTVLSINFIGDGLRDALDPRKAQG